MTQMLRLIDAPGWTFFYSPNRELQQINLHGIGRKDFDSLPSPDRQLNQSNGAPFWTKTLTLGNVIFTFFTDEVPPEQKKDNDTP